jgi:hypothetical protein
MAKRIEKFDSDDGIYRSPGRAFNDRMSIFGYTGDTFNLSSMPPQVIMTNDDDEVVSAWFPEDDPYYDKVTKRELSLVLNILDAFDVADLACPATDRIELAYNDFILDRIGDAFAPNSRQLSIPFNAGTGHYETIDFNENSFYSLQKRELEWTVIEWTGSEFGDITFDTTNWPAAPGIPHWGGGFEGLPAGTYCQLNHAHEYWHKTFQTSGEVAQHGASGPDPSYNTLVQAQDGLPADVSIFLFNYQLPPLWPATGFESDFSTEQVREIVFHYTAGITVGFITVEERQAYFESSNPLSEDLIAAAGNASGTLVSENNDPAEDLPPIFLTCIITVPSIVAMDTNAFNYVDASAYSPLLRLNAGSFDC